MSDGKLVPVKRALLSVYDKTGMAEFELQPWKKDPV